MNLLLDKMISHPAFFLAVSPDMSKIAIAGERVINIFSFPDLRRVEKVKVAHACSISFLSDNYSMVILNTSGKAFIWNGNVLESIGKWPVPKWQQRPAFLCADDHLLWAGYGGIWKYDVKNRVMCNIFASTKDIWICRYDKGLIKCVAMNYGNLEEEIEILGISLEGSIQRQSKTDIPIRNEVFKCPAWSDDDHIAISTSVRLGFPLNLLCLVDATGHVLSQEWIPAAEDNGSFYYGNNLFIKTSMVGSWNINFYDAHTLELRLKLNKQKLVSYGIDSPPTFAWIAPDNRILIGSWNALFVFDFE